MTRFLRCVAVVLSVVSLAGVARADDQLFGVSLMHGESLAGWDYGDPPSSGWTVADGRFIAAPGATPLLSGWTFGDVEIRFDWQAAGAIQVRFPFAPGSTGLSLALKGTASRARAAGQIAKPHSVAIVRKGANLSVSIDGQAATTFAIEPTRRIGLGLAVEGGPAVLSNIRMQEPQGEAIFNGHDLTGWWTPGDLSAWAVEDGAIKLVKRGGSYIRTEKLYANFTLRCEYRIVKGGNSGIGIRTPRLGWPSGDGMEMQIWDKPHYWPMEKQQTMAIYSNVPPLVRADKTGQWNQVVIKAEGRMISAWVNGMLCQQYNTAEHPELKWRHLRGWIGFQDHNDQIEARKVYVLEAPDGRGLDAWYAPRPTPAGGMIVDRLTNPERLSRDDGVRAAVVGKSVNAPQPSEHVLAELAGPGAVVRIARSSDEGTLAFYFDGQTTPRIVCKPAQLLKALPETVDDANPIVTCVCYAKSLKVVLRDAKKADYRFDYVTFPAGVPIESYEDPESGIPRGWLDAARYRTHQHGGGTVREYAPLPTYTGDKLTLAPGATRTLAQVRGAGFVQWMRVQGIRSSLEKNDLWLDAIIDGQTQPAISAPARYWFAPLVGGGNFHNFLHTDRGGMTFRLAVPFGDGFVLRARNVGTKPIAGLSATLCVVADEPTASGAVSRMRLRGAFLPAADNSELVSLSGAGRWIGIACQQPEAGKFALASLTVDGRSQPGWQDVSLDAFLGFLGGEGRRALGGRRGDLWWDYRLVSPVEFQNSLVLKTTGTRVGERLVLYYAKSQ